MPTPGPRARRGARRPGATSRPRARATGRSIADRPCIVGGAAAHPGAPSRARELGPAAVPVLQQATRHACQMPLLELRAPLVAPRGNGSSRPSRQGSGTSRETLATPCFLSSAPVYDLLVACDPWIWTISVRARLAVGARSQEEHCRWPSVQRGHAPTSTLVCEARHAPLRHPIVRATLGPATGAARRAWPPQWQASPHPDPSIYPNGPPCALRFQPAKRP
mmetsp:Transcript_81232/g.224882  ORF Transcript_81232/g.224882 Transcript_81232/m.224882 type:complete len:221 (-) Transcript_81232:26-688(-)